MPNRIEGSIRAAANGFRNQPDHHPDIAVELIGMNPESVITNIPDS